MTDQPTVPDAAVDAYSTAVRERMHAAAHTPMDLIRAGLEAAAPHIVARTFAGLTWVELCHVDGEPRLILTGSVETLRELAGRIPPARGAR